MGVLISLASSESALLVYREAESAFESACQNVSQETSEPDFKMGDCTRLCALIFALIFPPISVLLVRGCGCDFLLNIILTLLAYIPGMIHAFWVTLKADTADSAA